MLNRIELIGRLVNNPKFQETDIGDKVANITLAIPKNCKNDNGIYENDVVSCVLCKGIAENITNYIKKGDLIAVKGYVQTKDYEDKDGNYNSKLEVIAEKVYFLSNKREENTEELER